MTATVTLTPGAVALDTWEAIEAGAKPRIDGQCREAVEAGARTIAAVVAKGEPVYGVNTGFGKLAQVRIADSDLSQLQRNIVLSHAAGVGEPMPPAIARLMMALKLASLGRGASGVRMAVIDQIQAMLDADVIPVVPAQGSVGASGDLAPLAHMTAAMLGIGEAWQGGQRMGAEHALARAGLEPLELGPKEGLALLNGTQFSTAYALHGLFATRTVFRAALVTGALATDAAKGSDTPFDPRIHDLRGQPGQIRVAAALRRLMQGSAIRLSHLTNDDRVQDPYCLRCQPQVMGAALDIIDQAARMLEAEANGVTDNPLVLPEPGPGFDEGTEADEPQPASGPGDVLSGGNFHAAPVGFAADMLAMVLCEIGSLTERRIAMLVDASLSGLPAFLTPRPGLNSGFMMPQVTAAALVSENKSRAFPASVDTIPTSANQEDHVSMAAHGARRLEAMAENACAIVGIELLAAAQGCDFHLPQRSSEPLERVRTLLRARVPHLEDDRQMAPDIAAATELVRSGAVAEAAGVAGEVELDIAPMFLYCSLSTHGQKTGGPAPRES